jgi:hypothetical protein
VGGRRAKWKPLGSLYREEKATAKVLDLLGHTSVGNVRRADVPVEAEMSRVSELAGLAAILPIVSRQRKPPRGSPSGLPCT